MAIGTNTGNQLNVLLFELLVVVPRPLEQGGADVVSLALHPMFVSPSEWQSDDASRSAVTRNMDGVLRVVGVRALRSFTYTGTFGVQARGFGPLGGDGEWRRRRFEQEIVRLSDAVTNQDIEDAVGLFGTELGSQLTQARPLAELLAHFDIKRGHFAVNMYDFYNRRFMQVNVSRFSQTRSHRRAGATGAVWYNLSVQESGPLLDGVGKPSKLLDLLEITATVNDLLSLVDDVTLENATEAAALLAAVPLNFSPLESTAAALADAIRLTGGGGGLKRQRNLAEASAITGLSSLFTDVANGITEIREAIVSLELSAPAEYQPTLAWVDFESGTAPEHEPSTLAFDTKVDLLNIIDSLETQLVVGCFFGMSRQDYKTFVESGGDSATASPTISASVTVEVGSTDTPRSIERQYGVSWSTILAANGMTSDEALYPGTVIEIPVTRPRGNPGIEGLEVFDSHLGDKVLGSDLRMEIGVEAVNSVDPALPGDLITVSGPDCAAQGLQILIESHIDAIRAGIEGLVIGAREDFIAQRVRQVLKLDGRAASVRRVAVAIDPTSTGYVIDANVTLVNGNTVQIGA